MEYLYDSGSDTTLITEELFKQIQLEDKNTKLVKYNGKPLKSFTDEVKIIGELILNNCSFNQSDNLKNIRIIVTKNQISTNKCIIGTDLMKQIPEFDNALNMIEETINKMSENVINRYNNQKETHGNSNQNQEEFKSTFHLETIEEGDENKHKMDEVREHVQERLKQCAAKSLKEVKTDREDKVKFKIELINPNQRPLQAKARPLPHNLKDKVKQVIQEQEDAGIIRRSTSEWTSALRVVHKPDGDIRLTSHKTTNH